MSKVLDVATEVASCGVVVRLSLNVGGRCNLWNPTIASTFKSLRSKLYPIMGHISYSTPSGKFMPFSVVTVFQEKLETVFQDHAKFVSSILSERGEMVNSTMVSSIPESVHAWKALHPDDKGNPPSSFVMNYVREMADKIPSKNSIVELFGNEISFYPHPLVWKDQFGVLFPSYETDSPDIEVFSKLVDGNSENMAWRFLDSILYNFSTRMLSKCNTMEKWGRRYGDAIPYDRFVEIADELGILVKMDVTGSQSLKDALDAAKGCLVSSGRLEGLKEAFGAIRGDSERLQDTRLFVENFQLKVV